MKGDRSSTVGGQAGDWEVTFRHRRRGGRKCKRGDRRWVREDEQEYRVDAKIWSI